MAFAHTHTPLAYSVPFQNTSRSVFQNTLAEVDNSIGRIIAALDTAGLSNNTLVFLTADNGPADLGSVACSAIGSVGPFVGAWQKSPLGGGGGATAKTTTWEGGHRMLGVARWPGRIAAGRITNALASTLDFSMFFFCFFSVVDYTSVCIWLLCYQHFYLFLYLPCL